MVQSRSVITGPPSFAFGLVSGLGEFSGDLGVSVGLGLGEGVARSEPVVKLALVL